MVKRSDRSLPGAIILTVSLACVVVAYGLFFSFALGQFQAIEYEGPCLWASTQIARGLNPYPLSTLSGSPFAVIIYPPLYFCICSLFEHGTPSYLMPRVISMLSSLLTFVFYFYFLRTWYGRRISLTGSTLLMSFMAIWLWSAKGRVDELSLTLSALALLLYARSRRQEAKGTLAFAGLSLALATMTKQPSALIAPALVLDLLIDRRYKSALTFGAIYAVALGGSIALCQALTDGGFIAHMRFASHMPFEWRYLSERLSLMYVDWPKLFLSCLAVPLLLIRPTAADSLKAQASPFRLALLLVLTTMPVTFYTAGTAYSNVNHFLVLLLPLPLLICALASRLEDDAVLPASLGAILNFSYQSTVLLSGLLIVFLGFSLFGPAASRKLTLDRAVPDTELASLMRDRPVLSEDGGYGPLYGAISEPIDITTFIQVMGLDGKQAIRMKDNLEAKKYAVVVINHQELTGTRKMAQWDRSVIDALKNNYHFYGQTNGNWEVQDVYLPGQVGK